ncbi:MAG: preprotein translocase subunit SecG [Candidatus Omnitrophica bacterium]|nr:preprotein translocase subunit SecG [Candidatus Omnitrophota bacterium]MCM8830784.1 preprotein translocase subunit SecG [Candidatus Omnitrophota bacterium]
MYNLVLFLHILVVIFLLIVILIQRGRSGGLIEALGGVESIFGTKTSSFLVKLTVTLAILFFITTISLAYLSKEKGKSLMSKYKNIMEEKEQKNETPKTLPENNK